MASAFPGPGLHDKFYTDDQINILNVIQDTVGRHDTFNLACSAKYYDDTGYPGHTNCSDNLNAVLGPMGIAPRKGWPAVNFSLTLATMITINIALASLGLALVTTY